VYVEAGVAFSESDSYTEILERLNAVFPRLPTLLQSTLSILKYEKADPENPFEPQLVLCRKEKNQILPFIQNSGWEFTGEDIKAAVGVGPPAKRAFKERQLYLGEFPFAFFLFYSTKTHA
jgi:hypothetical protein